MPTLRDLQTAYPAKSSQELLNRWNETHPGQPLTNDVSFNAGDVKQQPTPPEQPPSTLQRLKGMATSPLALKTGGTLAGEAAGAGLMAALAPETMGVSLAGVPIARSVGGAVGNMAGDVASRFINNGPAATGSELALDAGEGALGTYGGKILGGLGKAAGFVGENLPWGAGFWSPATAAVKAGSRVAEPILNAGGRAMTALNDAVAGAGERFLGRNASNAAEERTAQFVREATARQAAKERMAGAVEQPYRMGSGAPKPYQPSAFRQAMNGPAPEMSVVEPTAGVAQSPGTMSEVDALLQRSGMTPKPAYPAVLTKANPESITNLRRFGHLDPYAGQGGLIRPAGQAMEGLPENSPEFIQAMEALNKASGPTLSPRLTNMATEQSNAFNAARQHGTGGFSRLPELSPAELQRLQALFSRVGGK